MESVARPARFVSAKNRRRRSREQKRRQKVFLYNYTKFGRVYVAAKKAGVHKGTHPRWLRECPEYRQQFKEIKAQLIANPPATLVPQAPRTYTRPPLRRNRPNGLGAVSKIKNGFAIRYYVDLTDGKRELLRDKLYNVTEEQAWDCLREKLAVHPPRVGPLRHGGTFPSVESLAAASNDSLSEPEPEIRSTRPFHCVKNAEGKWGGGSVFLQPRSKVLLYRDIDGENRRENVGNVTLAEAQALLKQRTEALLLARQRVKEELRQRVKEELARDRSIGLQSSNARKKNRGGRPPIANEIREKDRQAATSLKPRQWCINRDTLHYPLASVFEKYGSWVKAYDEGDDDDRQRLMIKKSQAKNHKSTDPYKNS